MGVESALPLPVFLLAVVCAVLCVVAVVATLFWQRARLLQDVLAAVPRPRQLVSSGGRVLFGNPAFVGLFGDARRAAPDILRERVKDDEDAHQALDRLADRAGNGVAGETELQLPGSDEPGGSPRHGWYRVAAYPLPRGSGGVL